MAPTANTGIMGLQESGTGTITSYQNQQLFGIGLAAWTTATQVYNQVGAVSSTAMLGITNSGIYLVSYWVEVTSASAQGSIQPLIAFTSDNWSSPFPPVKMLGGSFVGSQIAAASGRGNVATALNMIQCAASSQLYFRIDCTGVGGINPGYNYSFVAQRVN